MTSGGVPDEPTGAERSPVGAGRLVGGRYQLLECIGAGSMGTVWRAFDRLLTVDVAVKAIRFADELSPAERETRTAAAFREARNAVRLRRHPHVVTVLDVVEDDGLPWIVMELAPAISLEALVRRDGPLTARRTAEVGLAVLEALAAARDDGVLHRDVKPSNILLADDGRILLTDFGIATHVADTTLRGAGGSAGTPAYMAPERITQGPATIAADLFSLGATLYFAVGGNPPFARDTVELTLGAVLHVDPPPIEAAGSLWPVVGGLLIKNPRARLGVDGARGLVSRVLREIPGGARPATARPEPRPVPRVAGPGSVPRAAEAGRVPRVAGPGPVLRAAEPGRVPRAAEAPRRAARPSKTAAAETAAVGRGRDQRPPPLGRRPRLPLALLAAAGALAVLTLVLVIGLPWRSGDGAGTAGDAGDDLLPAGMAGAWSGTVTQGPVEFGVEIVLHGGRIGQIVGTSDYPADGCAADLRLLAADERGVTVQERLTRTGALCRGSDRLVLTLRPDGGLAYVFPATEINSVGAGILRRD